MTKTFTEVDVPFCAVNGIPHDQWIPWTAAQSLVRFCGRSIGSSMECMKANSMVINGQTCYRWGDVWNTATERVSENMRRLAEVESEMKELIRRYDELRKAVDNEKYARKGIQSHV